MRYYPTGDWKQGSPANRLWYVNVVN